MKIFLIVAIVLFDSYYLTYLFYDVWQHRNQLSREHVNRVASPLAMIMIYFLSTLGIGDFAVSTAIYHKTKWVSLKNLPGTLNVQCVIPSGVMSIIFLSTVTVGIKTLVVCIVSQVLGAYWGSKYAIRSSQNVIRNFIIAGLITASVFILAGNVGWINSTGNATQLNGWKLVLTAILVFIYGALDDIGIGCYAPTMATTYAMGMSPIAAFPIMMCGATFSLAVGGTQFIKSHRYSRKLALFSFFGIIGVLMAAGLFRYLSLDVLKWFVIVVLLYSAWTLYGSK